MAGRRNNLNKKIYELLVRHPEMRCAEILRKLNIGTEYSASVYRIRMEVKKEIHERSGREFFSETMQRQRDALDLQMKEAVDAAATREREKEAKKLRHAIQVGDAKEVHRHIDILIADLSNSDSSKEVLKKVFALFQEDLVHMQRAYNMLSQHHDSCLLRIADLERQNNITFGWKYLWKWLMHRIRPREDTGW